MRNILRQPRYFDDDYEAAALRCFRCGQGGHREAECTLPAKKKACHLCGFTSHIARDCPHGLCFNCLTPGHQSRDCPYQRGSVATRKSCVASGAGNPDTWSRIASIDSTRAISRRFTVTSAVRSDICAAPARLAASWTTKLLSMRRRGAPGPRVRALSKRIRRWRCPRIRVFPLRRARSHRSRVSEEFARSVRATTGGLFESAANLRRGFGRRERRRELARRRRTRTRRSIVFRSIARYAQKYGGQGRRPTNTGAMARRRRSRRRLGWRAATTAGRRTASTMVGKKQM